MANFQFSPRHHLGLEDTESHITARDFTQKPSGELTEDERRKVITEGNSFAASDDSGPWLFISGEFSDVGTLAEDQLQKILMDVLGYPKQEEKCTVNVLLDSKGGVLDSAFRIVLYLSRYTSDLNVYVPRRAKSASTLIALGATRVYLSAFGELGPLDAQIPDPRNRTAFISALDCYQSVDYVREFGFTTMRRALRQLVAQAGDLMPLSDLLNASSNYAIGSVEPMLRSITALDFGGWGRSLKIGEQYARILLTAKNPKNEDKADSIATQLVYGYTHHPFAIDYDEAKRLGLDPGFMSQAMYEGAMHVVKECKGKAFIGFISKDQSDLQEKSREEERNVEATNGRRLLRANTEESSTPAVNLDLNAAIQSARPSRQ